MGKQQIPSPEAVAERYRGGFSVGTLRNWRAMRLGPSFVKISKAVLYPIFKWPFLKRIELTNLSLETAKYL
ncbi:hypothetical protein [Rhizobium sullae]|uniref:hypothetical protein n=1 Tax=Rhizobium sullae TaxID=50338 RepID=UPI003CCB1F41